ncbi:uncharacterized protein [Pyrus communis]|uniref:uncharacterized protein n=1 Tax=Pyrus communis TaxID=23211 RepID=UPI0035C110F6
MAAELSGSENSGSDAELSGSENSDEIRHEFRAFCAAVRRGDWEEAREFLTLHPNVITATDSWGTALHNATIFGHEQIVEELVQLMTEEQLEIKDGDGWTAFACAVRENIKMVECMVTKNKKLLGIAVEPLQRTPIVIAARNDQWDIVRYLYSLTPPQDLMPDKGIYGSELVRICLEAKQFGIQIEPGHSVNDFRINIQNQENEQGNRRNNTGYIVLNVNVGINRIRKLKLIHVRSRQILDFMCEVIKHLNDEELKDYYVSDAIVVAVENGIVDVVTSLCKARPELLLTIYKDGKSLFHYAVECRQEKVYSLLYGVRQRNLITTFIDDSDKSMLHCAGMLSPLATEKLDRIPGAALQMQRERQWYKGFGQTDK